MFDLFESMFFRERSTQAEYFDAPGRPEAEMAAAFRELDRLNLIFRFSHPFVSRLPRWLGKERCRSLEILDVGAGTGLLGRRLSVWAQRRGWDWRFTNLDSNPVALKSGNAANRVFGSALQLPFADGSFDLVVASQMTHHLTDAEVVRHWREAWRVTRDGIFICDLHRNAGFYAMLWLMMRLMRADRVLREDEMISVKRGFRRREWRELAARAGIPNARVWLYYGTRIGLQARKGAR
ncbi:MAG TPA: methyltransferase domain-containing protein [Verrucomicrobiae bacterium]|nr:methyltransferase domain-containing protein [Verrucomicrobiae bacterium]